MTRARIAWILWLTISGCYESHLPAENAPGADVGIDAGVDAAVDGGPDAFIPPVDSCGDGIVQDWELCDPVVPWTGECPQGWGACVRCAHDCQTKMFPTHLRCSADDIEYRYDERANLVLLRITIGGGGLSREVRYEYDERFYRTLKITHVGNDYGLLDEARWTYDDQGRETSAWEDTLGDGVRDWERRTQYDGMSSRTAHLRPDGSESSATGKRVDAWGRTLESWTERVPGERSEITVSEYLFDGDAPRRLRSLANSSSNVDRPGGELFASMRSSYDPVLREVQVEVTTFYDEGEWRGSIANYDVRGRQVRWRGPFRSESETEWLGRGESLTSTYDDGELQYRQYTAPIAQAGVGMWFESFREGVGDRRDLTEVDAMGNQLFDDEEDQRCEFDPTTNHPSRCYRLAGDMVSDEYLTGCRSELLESLPFEVVDE